MKLIEWLLRLYAFLFHLPLALFFLGVSLVAAISGLHNLRFDMLPWTGKELTYSILAISLTGLLFMLLAARGKLKPLFAVYALYVFGQTVYGVFLSRYWIGSEEDMRWALAFTLGAFGAVMGALVHARAGKERRSRL